RRRLLFRSHFPRQLPAAPALELVDRLVGVVAVALPAAAVDPLLAVVDVSRRRKHQAAAVRGDAALAVAALVLDVEVLHLAQRGVPVISGLAEVVGVALAAHDMAVAQEAAVVDPFEAMLVGLRLVGEAALPAVAG